MWAPGDLNPEPTDYESGALTVELGALDNFRKLVKVISRNFFLQDKIQSLQIEKPSGQRLKFDYT